MRIKIIISLLFLLLGFSNLKAQTYNYSYSDPCTGNLKTIVVPINGSVTVGYYGFVENFTQQQFTDGTFETWANQVFSQYEGSPCAEIVGLGGQLNIGQDVALNTIAVGENSLLWFSLCFKIQSQRFKYLVSEIILQ